MSSWHNTESDWGEVGVTGSMLGPKISGLKLCGLDPPPGAHSWLHSWPWLQSSDTGGASEPGPAREPAGLAASGTSWGPS